MRAWQIEAFGIDSLEFAERPTSVPQAGEVQVEIRAVSLNYRDLLIIRGEDDPRLNLPRIPCSDAAGVVSAIGPGVTRFQPGDRVAPIFMQNWIDGPYTAEKSRGALGGDIDGVLAESILVKESGLVHIPEHLSFEEASTLPCAAVTAWNALAAGDLHPGATVLIQGTGGVSIFALQLARLSGVRVLGISSSDEKLQMAHTLGLDAGCNYHSRPDWDRWALEQTGGEGVDLVIEVGGMGTLPRSLNALRPGGVIAQVGLLSHAQGDTDTKFPLTQLLHKRARIQGIYVGSRADFIALNQALSLAQIRPVGENFHWSQARRALERLEEGSHFGKLVLSVN